MVASSDQLNAEERQLVTVHGYGHIGDGNLHLEVCVRGHTQTELLERLNSFVNPFVMDFVKKVRGSVSAEHGIGQQKRSFLDVTKSQAMIEYMQRIKHVFDPNGIMNPYKVLPHKQ